MEFDFYTKIVDECLEIEFINSGNIVYQPLGDFCEYEFFINYNSIITHDQYLIRRYHKFFPDIFADQYIIYDIGANAGIYTLASCKQTNGVIYSFEPSKKNFKALTRTVDKIKDKDYYECETEVIITPMNIAIGSDDGEIFFTDNSFSGMGRTSYVKETNESYLVEVRTIDSLVNEGNIVPPDIIKIDVEGAEQAVLSGAIDTINKYNPIILMSAYHGQDDDVVLPMVLKTFTDEKYSCKLLKRAFCENIFICYEKSHKEIMQNAIGDILST